VIVVDASAAVSALLNRGPARSTLTSESVHVPHLIDAEIASALRRLAASRKLPVERAEEALVTWGRLGVVRHPLVGMLDRIWALRYVLSAYDACYVALAELFNCNLMTADIRLSHATGIRCAVTVVPR